MVATIFSHVQSFFGGERNTGGRRRCGGAGGTRLPEQCTLLGRIPPASTHIQRHEDAVAVLQCCSAAALQLFVGSLAFSTTAHDTVHVDRMNRRV